MLLWNRLLRDKNLLGRWLKLGYFSSVCPRQLFFLQIYHFPVNSESFWAKFQCPRTFFSSISGIKASRRAIRYKSTSCRSQQSNWFSTQFGDSGYFTAEKHPNSGNWLHTNYLIKIGLLWSHLPQAKKPVCHGLVLWSFGKTDSVHWHWVLQVSCVCTASVKSFS